MQDLTMLRCLDAQQKNPSQSTNYIIWCFINDFEIAFHRDHRCLQTEQVRFIDLCHCARVWIGSFKCHTTVELFKAVVVCLWVNGFGEKLRWNLVQFAEMKVNTIKLRELCDFYVIDILNTINTKYNTNNTS